MTGRGPSSCSPAVAGCAHASGGARRRAAAQRDRGISGRLIAGDRAAIAAGVLGRAVDRRSVRGRGARRPRARPFVARAPRVAGGARGAARRPARRRAPAAAPSSRRCCTFATRAATSICRSRSSATTRRTGGCARCASIIRFWPLEGHHRVRPPLLRRDPAALTTGAVAEYQRALAAGDVDAIVATFEPDGYFREPSGEPWVHRGPVELRKFMTQILGAGGIGIDHTTVTDDGKICAIEFNAVRFGKRAITPQAGLAIYERGPTGRLPPPASTTTSTSRCCRGSERGVSGPSRRRPPVMVLPCAPDRRIDVELERGGSARSARGSASAAPRDGPPGPASAARSPCSSR